MSAIEAALQAALDAREAHADLPTKERRQAFLEARGAFRNEATEVLRGALADYCTAWELVTGEATEIFEELVTLQNWFHSQGLETSVPRTWAREVNLPSTRRGKNAVICGTQARPARFKFEEFFTEEAQEVWNDDLAIPGLERVEREAPFTAEAWVRELNAPLGTG
ncbi:hypothetical protein EYC87_05300 [Halieaceae bacterium IMCC8485]|uniref:Uncharacterized protein n=1 Tax=Candidatus Seongchinamella marina TaxID=2518990 RepID=A0ABT3SSQ0_9GAMM|nr:hypothetical protein [Candidatus Seongchinamella marina]MCX2973000.1 hypothetical protein [Candidatus Seongchinamella marina]